LKCLKKEKRAANWSGGNLSCSQAFDLTFLQFTDNIYRAFNKNDKMKTEKNKMKMASNILEMVIPAIAKPRPLSKLLLRRIFFSANIPKINARRLVSPIVKGPKMPKIKELMANFDVFEAADDFASSAEVVGDDSLSLRSTRIRTPNGIKANRHHNQCCPIAFV
jgi:hypothetical protein